MAAITAAILTMSFPMNILAASNRPDDNTYQAPEAPAPNYNKDMSPEFAYTEEKWASLRDNVMEYGELEDLIQSITLQSAATVLPIRIRRERT